MTALRIEPLDPSDYRHTPWKNGGGVTVDIVLVTDKDAEVWRFGRTPIVQPGPFSDYSGFDRVQVLVAGSGLVLKTPEGEIDVFAFIAATMEDDRGFIQFIFTLALFQNATVTTVGGRHIPIARADTIADAGATDRLADALWRASRCTADVMGGVDHFALADTPLEELRQRWLIPAKTAPSPGALDPARPRPGIVNPNVSTPG